MSALSLQRQQDRLAMILDAAARAVAASTNGSMLSRAQLFGISTEHPEYFFAHALAKAWEAVGWIAPEGTGDRGAALYKIVDRERFRLMLESDEDAAIWISPPKPADAAKRVEARDVLDFIVPRTPASFEVEPEPDVSDDELLAPFAEAHEQLDRNRQPAAPAEPSVVDAIVGALERATKHIVEVESKLERDSKERDAQTDLLLSLGEKLEGFATKKDISDATAMIGAELVQAMAVDSPKPAIERLYALLSERIEDDRAWRASVDARLDAFEKTMLSRLDTQREIASRAEGKLSSELRAILDEKLPQMTDVSQNILRAYKEAEEAGSRIFKLYQNLVNATGQVFEELRLNSEVTVQAARGLVEVLGAAAGSDRVKKTIAQAASALGTKIVLHEHSRKDDSEIRTTDIEPTEIVAPIVPRGRGKLAGRLEPGVVMGFAAGLGLGKIGGGEEFVEKKDDEKKPEGEES